MRSFDELYIVMELCDSDMKKLIKTDVLLTPLHINTLLYNLLVGLEPSSERRHGLPRSEIPAFRGHLA